MCKLDKINLFKTYIRTKYWFLTLDWGTRTGAEGGGGDGEENKINKIIMQN